MTILRRDRSELKMKILSAAKQSDQINSRSFFESVKGDFPPDENFTITNVCGNMYDLAKAGYLKQVPVDDAGGNSNVRFGYKITRKGRAVKSLPAHGIAGKKNPIRTLPAPKTPSTRAKALATSPKFADVDIDIKLSVTNGKGNLTIVGNVGFDGNNPSAAQDILGAILALKK